MNEEAVAEFVKTLEEIEELLLALTEAKDDNFGTDPDTLHWGHVGDIHLVHEYLILALAVVEGEQE